MQLVFLEVLHQRAAGTVDDALGDAGRSRRVEDVERVIERQQDELEGLRIRRTEKRLPQFSVPQVVHVRGGVDVGNDHRPLHGRQCLEDGPDARKHRVNLAGVNVGVWRHQHARGDLAEPVEHAVNAKVW